MPKYDSNEKTVEALKILGQGQPYGGGKHDIKKNLANALSLDENGECVNDQDHRKND